MAKSKRSKAVKRSWAKRKKRYGKDGKRG